MFIEAISKTRSPSFRGRHDRKIVAFQPDPQGCLTTVRHNGGVFEMGSNYLPGILPFVSNLIL
jgi:hypothetical protein